MLTKDSDNQLSTVLLLIALGFLIYYLTQPKKVEVEESFADVEPVQGPAPAQVVVQPISSNVVSQPVATEQAKQADVSPEMLNQILNESVAATPVEAVKQTAGYNFMANDSADAGEGALLDSAFANPLGSGAALDMVNLNAKNNEKYNSSDFLPKEINDQWFDTDFSQSKNNVSDDKLINTDRYVIGINTVGQSLKNATYDIRGTIPNPKFTLSPWHNSTYEADYNIKPLC